VGSADCARAVRSPEGDGLGWLFGIPSGGSLWWARRRLAAGAFVRVLVGSLGCVGSGMVRVGGIRGAGASLAPSQILAYSVGRWSLFGRKPCPTLSVPVTSTLLSAEALLGGVIEDGVPPPLAPGENPQSGSPDGAATTPWRRFLLEGAAFGATGPCQLVVAVWFFGFD
jgi:hypothetical protein